MFQKPLKIGDFGAFFSNWVRFWAKKGGKKGSVKFVFEFRLEPVKLPTFPEKK